MKMDKKIIFVFSLLVASILIAGCTQQAPAPSEGGEQLPSAGEEITTSALGDELTGAESSDSDLGDADITALEDVEGTL